MQLQALTTIHALDPCYRCAFHTISGFSSSFLKAALPGFVSSSQNLVEHLGAKADQQEVVLMHHVAVLTTLEIICKVIDHGLNCRFMQSMATSCLQHQS